MCYGYAVKKSFYGANNLEERDPETSRGFNVLASDDFI